MHLETDDNLEKLETADVMAWTITVYTLTAFPKMEPTSSDIENVKSVVLFNAFVRASLPIKFEKAANRLANVHQANDNVASDS